MRKRILVKVLMIGISLQTFAQETDQKKIWKDAEKQVSILLTESKKKRSGKLIFPRTSNGDSLKLVHSNDWTSGFFPGMLWMMYEYTGKSKWKKSAQDFTALMHKEPYNRNSHDVGFKVYNSYGQGYRLTKDSSYKRMIIEGARTLVSRFNPNVCCIRSWDFGDWQYPVIIDNMMNLELLFAATKLTGDSVFYKVAVTHANTTLKNHFRSDHSSYHVIDYDTLTGAVRSKTTHQGYADESSWARGQAWALYGYTMCYRETGNVHYLKQAKLIADFILNHKNLPKDKIPYWDYNAKEIEKEPRDVSAATITASALYELIDFVKEQNSYRQTADNIIQTITNHYRASVKSKPGFILLHSTGHKPANGEVDVPLIYADYYYLEALLRSR